jgi:hypothetical protein
VSFLFHNSQWRGVTRMYDRRALGGEGEDNGVVVEAVVEVAGEVT